MKLKRIVLPPLWLCLLYVASIMPISLSATGESLENQCHDHIARAHSTWGFSGSIMIQKDGAIVLAEGFGLADREKNLPNREDTRFLLCSATKQFTAAAVLQLAEKGRLSLDDAVTKYFPKYANSPFDKIKIYNLLTQTSGLKEYLSLVDSNESFTRPVSPDSLIARFLAAPLEFEPGTRWQYSNSNYYLLGKIIEIVSGIAYNEYMEQSIFDPLGMNCTGLPDRYLKDIPDAALGYVREVAGALMPAPFVHSSWPFAAGGLHSSVLDLARWNNGLRDTNILTGTSIARMFTPFQWRYGCGWEIDTLFGRPVASHGGTGGGYCSLIIRFIDNSLCVAALSNVENDFKYVSRLAYDLVAMMLGQSPKMAPGSNVVTVDPQLLEEYAGNYELAPGMVLSFRHRDGKLFTQGPGQPEVEIFPRNETEFFLKVVEGSVTFVRDSAGSVSGIIIHQGGRDISAQKLK